MEGLVKLSQLGPFDFEHKYYKLRHWVNFDELHMVQLFQNPNALYYILQTGTINLFAMAKNRNFTYLLQKSLSGICCNRLSSEGEKTSRILEKNIYKICWFDLFENPYAYDDEYNVNWSNICKNTNTKIIKVLEKIIDTNFDKIDWVILSANPSAISILEKYPDMINWTALSRNKNAMHLLEQNLEKIDWDYLCTNPSAISLLEKNMDKINWTYLSINPNAIHLLEKNIDKIDWRIISLNPQIYNYDYKSLKERMKNSGIARGIMENRFHPRNMDNWESWGHVECDDV